MSRVVFIDTETTSLRPDRRAWDIGLLARDPSTGVDIPSQWFVRAEDLELDNADPFALKIGGFYERHPQMIDARNQAVDERSVLLQVERITRGAHLVGAVPNFDAEVLGTRMRAHGIAPSWHYHLIDVEALAVGFLAGCTQLDMTRLPWESDWLHTALGDARWARAIYDRVTGGAA